MHVSPGEVAPVSQKASEPSEAFYIPSLDGIRAISFSIVFIAHAWLLQSGAFGVSVFFFLSGFLITTLLRRENDKFSRISIGNFYLRRVLRIFPPLYLTIATIAALVALRLIPGRLEFAPFLAASTFAANYYDIYRGFAILGLSPLWSLAVEEHFYLFFPFLFLILNRFALSYRKQALILGAICMVVLAWRVYLVLHYPSISQNRIMYGTDTRIDTILFGCILALAANPSLDRKLRFPRYVTLGAVLLLACTLGFRNDFFRLTVRYTLQGIAFIPLFVFAIQRAGDWTRFLNDKRVRFFGTLSYTLYLIHLAVLSLTASIPSRIVGAGVALAVSVLYAWAMNFGIERPLARVRRSLDKGRAA